MNDVIKFFGPPDRRAEKCFLLRLSAAVIAAGMTFFVAAAGMFLPVVVTHGIGIVDKIACDKRRCVLVGISHGAGIDLNAGLSESVSGAAANPAADELCDAEVGKKTRKSPVAGAVCGDDLAVYNLPVFDVIHFKRLGMSEMLKNFSVLISYCKLHCCLLFCAHVRRVIVHANRAAYCDLSALDDQ